MHFINKYYFIKCPIMCYKWFVIENNKTFMCFSTDSVYSNQVEPQILMTSFHLPL